MLYILETNFSEHKPVFFALAKVHGIGKKTAFYICKKLGFSINVKIKHLNQKQVTEMLQLIDSLNILLNNELKKFKSLTLKNLVAIKSYRGLRKVRGLPVRGQRTHTNARSAKKNKRF